MVQAGRRWGQPFLHMLAARGAVGRAARLETVSHSDQASLSHEPPMGLPRYGFHQSSGPAVHLGRGPEYPTGPRLAYGPGPGGSFETFYDLKHEIQLPPLHIYKERTPFFFLPPRTETPQFKIQPRQKPPAWAERLSKRPGELEVMRTMEGAPRSRANLQRPGSAAALLEQMEKHGGSQLASSKSALALLKSAPSDAKVTMGCGGLYIISKELTRPPSPSKGSKAKLVAAGGSPGASTATRRPKTASSAPAEAPTRAASSAKALATEPANAAPPAQAPGDPLPISPVGVMELGAPAVEESKTA